jgi:hypothetical protein
MAGEFQNSRDKFEFIEPKTIQGFEDFDINQIYAAIASYRGLPFPFGISLLPAYKIKKWSYRLALLNGEDRDMYGRPVIMPVQIDNVVLGSGMEDGFHITMQPMVVFEGKKKIVKNTIGGGVYEGTVKEFINFADYKISIIGAVISRNQKEYPLDQVQILKNLWKRNEALLFQNAITDDLFDYIVIEDIKFKELNRSPGIQMYEIKALSDSVIEIDVLKGDAADTTLEPQSNYVTDQVFMP